MKRFLLLLVLLILPFVEGWAVVAKTVDSLDVVILGDSNTWLGGDDCSREKGWNTWFARLFPQRSCKSYARSGATWTNTLRTKRDLTEVTGRISDNNVIYNQICRLIDAQKKGSQVNPQLIIVAAGTNDAWFPDKRPQAFRQQHASELRSLPYPLPDELRRLPQTLAASVQYDCLLLKKHFSSSHIVLLTPLQTTAVTEQKINETGNIIEDVAQLLSIPVVRQDKVCCVKRATEAKKPTYTYDGTHTNEQGAQKNGEILARAIQKILKKTS